MKSMKGPIENKKKNRKKINHEKIWSEYSIMVYDTIMNQISLEDLRIKNIWFFLYSKGKYI